MKLFTILAALFVSANSIIQAQDCLWAKSAGSAGYDNGNSTCTDANGNVYVVGDFGSITITFGTTTLTNVGLDDIFFVKYNSEGVVLWAKSAGGSGSDYVTGISADANGNIYLTGHFYSPAITFGTTVLDNASSTSSTLGIFIVKYSPEGNVLWAKSAGSNIDSYSNDISTDGSGNIYITGYFKSPNIVFGTTTLTNASSSNNTSDIFIVKYSPEGAVLWANSAGGIGNDFGNDVTVDSNGNIYINGFYNSANIVFGTTTLTNTGNNDFFIVKYGSSGAVIWAKSAAGNFNDFGNDVTTDISGNIYFTGSFSSPTITFGSTTLTNTGNNNFFIVKYGSDGTVIWAKSAGGSGFDLSTSVKADVNGNVYIIGNFGSSIITFGTITLTKIGDVDIFITKYSPNGTELWANSVAGGISSTSVKPNSISTDVNGNIYLTGAFASSNITFGTTTLTNAGKFGNDFFIAKYSGVSTGLNEAFNNSQLIISPNPTNSSITLTMPALKNSNVSITTLTGTEVGNYTTQNTSTQTIDISHLASGVYFVSLKSEEGLVTKKIIKRD
jgi:hypothetical protein